MRDGSTSVARMLPDTSIASMMVCLFDGRCTTATGRAAATSMSPSATSISAGGTWRFQVERRVAACRTSARLANATAFFLRRRSSHT